MNLQATLGGHNYVFSSIKDVMAKAGEEKSGDQMAGIAASTMSERIAAKEVLATLTIDEVRNNPVVPYEEDEVTRIIQDSVN